MAIPLDLFPDISKHDKDFFENVLITMRDDEIGQICKTDPVILSVGKRMWLKDRLKDKRFEIRNLLWRLFISVLSNSKNLVK